MSLRAFYIVKKVRSEVFTAVNTKKILRYGSECCAT